MPLWTPQGNLWMPVDLFNPVNRQHPLAQGLVAWWLCVPGIDGGKFWYDLTGFNHGTLTNMDSASGWRPAFNPGAFGNMLFDGTDDYVSIGTNAALNLTGNCAIAAWILTSNTGANKYIAASSNSGITAIQIAFRKTTADKLQLLHNSGTTLTGTAALSTNIWYHAGVQRYGSTGSWTLETWLNGKSDNSSSTANNPEAQSTFSIGRPGAANQQYWQGRIDCVMVYNRRLASSEWAWIYNNTRTGFPGLLNSVARKFYSFGSTAWSQSLSETLSLSDIRLMGANKALSETLSLTDARAMAFGKALAETLTLSDLKAGGANKLLAEALSLADVRVAGVAKALSDSLALSDAFSGVLNPSGTAWTKALYEVLSLTDSMAVALGSLLVIVTEEAGRDSISRSFIEDVVARVSAQDIIRRSGGRA